MTSSSSELLTMSQAATALKTSRATLYRWLREGKIKGLKTGRQWRFRSDEVSRFLEGRAPSINLPTGVEPLLKELKDSLGKPIKFSRSDPLEDVFNLMIRVAVDREATSIHLASHHSNPEQAPSGWLRLRVDGFIQPLCQLDSRLVSPIVRYWKQKASCDVQTTRLPQDGLLIVESDGEIWEIRVSFLPTKDGESLTGRIKNRRESQPLLEELQFRPRDLEALEKSVKKRNKLILVCGAAGSDVESLVATCLREVSLPEIKLMAVDHPSFRAIPWCLPLNLRTLGSNPNPATAIRTMLRSEPDVIGLPRISDVATLDAVTEAVLGGCLVVGGFRAESAIRAGIELSEMLGQNQVGQIVELIVAQRNLRKLCTHCKKKSQPSPAKSFELESIAKSGGIGELSLRATFEAEGCAHCGYSGYRGQVWLREVLVVSPTIAQALNHSPGELEGLAVARGMTTLDAQSLELVAQGLIGLEEAIRLLGGM